jgi:outer membrane protein assembly factor BamC
MNIRNQYVVIVGAAALFCGGCSYLPDLQGDKIDYKTARRLPPLEVPPDLARPNSDGSYDVPGGKGDTTYSAYTKERAVAGEAAGTLLPNTPGVTLQREGTQRWLVVQSDPKKVWDIAHDFWEENGFVIASEDPSAGVMDTDWVLHRDKVPDDNPIRGMLGRLLSGSGVHTVGAPIAAATRVKFRTRLEAGAAPGTTELYISNQTMVEGGTTNQGETMWTPQPSNPEIEAEMLRKIMVLFGVKQEVAQTQVTSEPQEARATLLKDRGGSGVLAVNDQFDRAWRRVGLALDRVGFTVEDRDRSKGLYFVRYIDPDALKASESKGILQKINPFSKDSKKPEEQYRIQVKDATDTSEVSVLSKDGNAETSDTAKRILSLLYEQLK